MNFKNRVKQGFDSPFMTETIFLLWIVYNGRMYLLFLGKSRSRETINTWVLQVRANWSGCRAVNAILNEA